MSDVVSARADWEEIDATTRIRVGELRAYGLVETQISDTLLLSVEQVVACLGAPDCRAAIARVAQERQKMRQDLEDGWDAVEERALESVLKTLEFNRDPNFALIAAKAANSAKRRATRDDDTPHRVLNADKASNVVVIQLNKTYVTNSSGETNGAILDVTPRRQGKPIQQKRTDILPPKTIQNMITRNKDQKDISDMQSEAFNMALEMGGIAKMLKGDDE